jgi:hypothetical protein
MNARASTATPLHGPCADDAEMVELLCGQARESAREPLRRPPLWLASVNGSPKVVALLLRGAVEYEHDRRRDGGDDGGARPQRRYAEGIAEAGITSTRKMRAGRPLMWAPHAATAAIRWPGRRRPEGRTNNPAAGGGRGTACSMARRRPATALLFAVRAGNLEAVRWSTPSRVNDRLRMG